MENALKLEWLKCPRIATQQRRLALLHPKPKVSASWLWLENKSILNIARSERSQTQRAGHKDLGGGRHTERGASQAFNTSSQGGGSGDAGRNQERELSCGREWPPSLFPLLPCESLWSIHDTRTAAFVFFLIECNELFSHWQFLEGTDDSTHSSLEGEGRWWGGGCESNTSHHAEA